MTGSELEYFRAIAAAMAPDPHTWQWLGAWPSQRHFGITRTRAESLAAQYGGTASEMTP